MYKYGLGALEINLELSTYFAGKLKVLLLFIYDLKVKEMLFMILKFLI